LQYIYIPYLFYASCCVLLLYMVFLMHPSKQQFHNKQINTTVLAFVYCVEVLLHVSTLLDHHQAIITWICHSSLDCLPIWTQISDLCIFHTWLIYNFNCYILNYKNVYFV
jgi:hypothetical protein